MTQFMYYRLTQGLTILIVQFDEIVAVEEHLYLHKSTSEL